MYWVGSDGLAGLLVGWLVGWLLFRVTISDNHPDLELADWIHSSLSTLKVLGFCTTSLSSEGVRGWCFTSIWVLNIWPNNSTCVLPQTFLPYPTLAHRCYFAPTLRSPNVQSSCPALLSLHHSVALLYASSSHHILPGSQCFWWQPCDFWVSEATLLVNTLAHSYFSNMKSEPRPLEKRVSGEQLVLRPPCKSPWWWFSSSRLFLTYC